MEKSITITMTAADDGTSVEQYLRKELQLTKAQIRSLKFRRPGIQINGLPARTCQVLHSEDRLELFLENPDDTSVRITPTNHPVEILYEDEDVICVWKPCGTATHPAGAHQNDTLSNYVLGYLMQKNENVRIRSIGRLDLDTEGILVFAKNKIAASRLWEQRQNHLFQKEYLALCQGSFPPDAYAQEQILSLPVIPAEDGTKRMKTSTDGPEAVTCYQALFSVPGQTETAQPQTIVRLRLKTGRTHQIRVHMAALGHPLFGDPLYGNGVFGLTHAHLSAWKIRFWQPFTREPVCLSHRPDRIPLPDPAEPVLQRYS